MERTPEPELMDTTEQAEAYARADFATPNRAFVERLLERFPTLGGTLVDLGCGPADIPLRLVRARPNLKITAVDGSAAMLAEAKRAIEAAGLGANIELVQGILPGAVRDGRRFDAVISNSLLHHLADPNVLWQEIRALAAPGAAILVGDLFRPETKERAKAIVEAYSGDEPEVLKTDFFNSLLAAFTPEEVTEQLRAAGLEGHLTVDRVSDRHLVVHGHHPR